MSQQAMQQALEALRAVVSVADRATAEFDLARTAIAALEKELALRTAGAAGPAGDDEVMPVAWRVKNETPGLHWTYFEQRPNWHYENGYEVEPLYTSPAIEANDAKDAALADLAAAVKFQDQVREGAKLGEQVTGTGIARDAREWIDRAARAVVAAMSTHQPVAAGVPGNFNDQGEK